MASSTRRNGQFSQSLGLVDVLATLGRAGLVMAVIGEVLSWGTGAAFPFLLIAVLPLGCIALMALINARVSRRPGPARPGPARPAPARPAPARPKISRPAPTDTVPTSDLMRSYVAHDYVDARRYAGSAQAEENDRRRRAQASQVGRRAQASQVDRVPSSWKEAEQSAAKWMQSNGYLDAAVTPAGADGGIDVISARAIAQVKFQQKPVGSAVIQQLKGATSSPTHRGREALFFSAFGYSAPAMKTGRELGVQLYQYGRTGWVRVA